MPIAVLVQHTNQCLWPHLVQKLSRIGLLWLHFPWIYTCKASNMQLQQHISITFSGKPYPAKDSSKVYKCQSHMNIIALCDSVYFWADRETKNKNKKNMVSGPDLVHRPSIDIPWLTAMSIKHISLTVSKCVALVLCYMWLHHLSNFWDFTSE